MLKTRKKVRINQREKLKPTDLDKSEDIGKCAQGIDEDENNGKNNKSRYGEKNENIGPTSDISVNVENADSNQKKAIKQRRMPRMFQRKKLRNVIQVPQHLTHIFIHLKAWVCTKGDKTSWLTKADPSS